MTVPEGTVRILRVYGLSHGCKKTRVSLRFRAGRLLNPQALARSSMVGWGPWQTSAKVQTLWGPAWYVTTAGHGGFILVTQTNLTPFGEPTWRAETAIQGVLVWAYVYQFEEDCDWTI